MKTIFGLFIAIVICVIVFILATYSIRNTTQESLDEQTSIGVGNGGVIIRVVDEEYGVVCYTRQNIFADIYCLPISDGEAER